MRNKYVLILLLLFIAVISASFVSAADLNQTSTADNNDVSEYSISNSDDLNNALNTIKSSESRKSTINMNNGSYNSFDLDIDNVDLEINGNNQLVNADININIGSNAKVTINSLTLNHTGKNSSVIINNGILRLNDVKITNSHIPDLNVTSSKDVVNDVDAFYNFLDERGNVLSGKIYNDSVALSIINNNRLSIDNSYFEGNVINSTYITNNYLTSVNNSNFVNNYADSLFTNNGKLRITNTDIGTNYLNHLVQINSSNTSFEPETYIKDSDISYSLLNSVIVDDTNSVYDIYSDSYEGESYSTTFITGCNMKDLINPYWAYDSDWANNVKLGFEGRKVLYNNSDNRFNNIQNFDNKTRTYCTEYQKEFNNYFEDKEIPSMDVEYNTNLTTINVKLTDMNGKSIDNGSVVLIIDDEEIELSDNNIENGQASLELSDSYLIPSADQIIVTYTGNENYSRISKYYNEFSNEKIPGIKTRKYVSLVIDDYSEIDPLNNITFSLDFYHTGDSLYVADEIPKNSKINFYLDNNLIDYEEIEFLGYNSSDAKYYYTYKLPENISNTKKHVMNVEVLNPEYAKMESKSNFYLNITDETVDDDINASINISKVSQEAGKIIIEGQIFVDYPDYKFTGDIEIILKLNEWESWRIITDSTLDYFTGKYQIIFDDSWLKENQTLFHDYYVETGLNNFTVEYSDYIYDTPINPIKNITFEVNQRSSGLILKNYTVDNITTILDDTVDIVEINQTDITNTNKTNITNTNKTDTTNTNKTNRTDTDTDKINENTKPITAKNTQSNNYNKNIPKNTFKKTITKNYSKKVTSNTNTRLTVQSNFNITLSWLNQLFNNDFRNQSLLIYIDDTLVFNSTVDDDLLKVVFTIKKEYSGQHTLKVVCNNNTYTQDLNII